MNWLILGSTCVSSENHCETTESFKICFNCSQLIVFTLESWWHQCDSSAKTQVTLLIQCPVSVPVTFTALYYQRSKSMRSRPTTTTSSWDRCCFLTFVQRLEASFSLFNRTHRTKDTVTLLDQETPDFILSALWPPNLPDINPVDYTVWSVFQERVYLPRCRTSTNWNDASTASGLSNVLRVFTARCTLVQSAVLRSHVVRLSVCNVGGSGPHRLEILETNCTNN